MPLEDNSSVIEDFLIINILKEVDREIYKNSYYW